MEEKTRVMISFSRQDLDALKYPVMVEGWTKKDYGRVKSEFLKAFDANERRVLHNLYKEFSRWYLVSGTPRNKVMSMRVYNIAQRGVNFFGTI